MHALDALGNPVRRDILRELQRGPCSVNELASRFPVTRPAVSRHLRLLREAGLVEPHPDGNRTVYAVRLEGLAPARAYLDTFWDDALSRLEALAQQETEAP